MGNKAFDVTALGELLIDFTENGNSAQGNPMLEANPGGAPCNVLAMLEKLGKKTAFIGKVGNDMFGTQLKNAVEEVGIDTRNLVIDNEVHTTLAFVHKPAGSANPQKKSYSLSLPSSAGTCGKWTACTCLCPAASPSRRQNSLTSFPCSGRQSRSRPRYPVK